MSTPAQGSTSAAPPPQCEHDVYEHGECIMILAGPRSAEIEAFVIGVRELSGQRVDWHFMGGRAVILYLGDRERVREAIEARSHTSSARRTLWCQRQTNLRDRQPQATQGADS